MEGLSTLQTQFMDANEASLSILEQLVSLYSTLEKNLKLLSDKSETEKRSRSTHPNPLHWGNQGESGNSASAIESTVLKASTACMHQWEALKVGLEELVSVMEQIRDLDVETEFGGDALTKKRLVRSYMDEIELKEAIVDDLAPPDIDSNFESWWRKAGVLGSQSREDTLRVYCITWRECPYL